MNTKSAHPRSVVRGIPRLGRKPEGWREVAFGDVLKVVKRPATIDPDHSYQLINVKRNRGGVIPRETKRGSEIKTKTQFYVAAEDFVVSRRQIVHGACGIVPPKLDGALVSNEYSTFVPKKGLCLEFLTCFSHTSHFQKTCFHASVGVVIEKMIFNLDDWLKHRFYLPPLKEQERIVRILAAADRAIARTEDLIEAKRKLKEGLAKLLLTGKRRLPDCKAQWCERSISDLAEINPRTAKPPSLDTQVSFVPMANISEGGGLISPPVRPYRDVASGFTAFQDGDVLVSKITPCFENQKGALAQELSNGYGFGTTELHVLRAKAYCSARFLFYASMSEGFRARGVANMTGSAGQRRVPAGFIQSYRLQVPSLPEQERIATVLDTIDRSLEVLKQKLTSLRYLKHGLMQKLLPSEPRVEAS